jgi:hypothetical protein
VKSCNQAVVCQRLLREFEKIFIQCCHCRFFYQTTANFFTAITQMRRLRWNKILEKTLKIKLNSGAMGGNWRRQAAEIADRRGKN